YDPATGLQYNRERWYDPYSGRWITQDPSGFMDGPNLYVYVHNAPTNQVDPSGRWGQPAPVELGEGITARVDKRGNPFGGFEIHVYSGKTEIAKLNGAGGWVATHEGAELATPSAFKTQLPEAYQNLRKLASAEAREAARNGLRVG